MSSTVSTPTEELESRRLFSATITPQGTAPLPDTTPPTLDAMRVVGPPWAATAIQLRFSEPLDRARAERASAYEVLGDLHRKSRGDANITIQRRSLALASATYDDAARTVTLLPLRGAFSAKRFPRFVFADALGDDAVTDVAGNPLVRGRHQEYADADERHGVAVLKVNPPVRGRSITYHDGNHSMVRLRLSGGGYLVLLRRDGWADFDPIFDYYADEDDRREPFGEAEQVWLAGKVTARSVLTGRVTLGRRGLDATTTLKTLAGAGPARIELLNDPAFLVGLVTP